MPEFLSLTDVLTIHHHQIEEYGGDASVRDLGLLQSAIAMPAQGFGGEYLHTNLAQMAAAYLFHIVKNHPFVDGNKRTGLASALAFLKKNNVAFKMPLDELEAIVLGVASGSVGKDELTRFIESYVTE